MRLNEPLTDMEQRAIALARQDRTATLFLACRVNPNLERISGTYSTYMERAKCAQ